MLDTEWVLTDKIVLEPFNYLVHSLWIAPTSSLAHSTDPFIGNNTNDISTIYVVRGNFFDFHLFFPFPQQAFCRHPLNMADAMIRSLSLSNLCCSHFSLDKEPILKNTRVSQTVTQALDAYQTIILA